MFGWLLFLTNREFAPLPCLNYDLSLLTGFAQAEKHEQEKDNERQKMMFQEEKNKYAEGTANSVINVASLHDAPELCICRQTVLGVTQSLGGLSKAFEVMMPCVCPH